MDGKGGWFFLAAAEGTVDCPRMFRSVGDQCWYLPATGDPAFFLCWLQPDALAIVHLNQGTMQNGMTTY